MRIIYVFSFYILWSGISSASEPIYYDNQIYKTVSGYPFEVNSEYKEITFQPKYKSQDSIGACTGFASWVIAQQYYCKKMNIQDCANPPANADINPYGLVLPTDNNDFSNKSLPSNTEDTVFQGDSYENLSSLASNGTLKLDSCMPSDQIANDFPDTISNEKHQAETERMVRDYYERRSKGETEANICTECITERIKESYGVQIIPTDLDKVFKDYNTNFKKFFYILLLKKCKAMADFTDFDFKLRRYPEEESQEPYNPQVALEIIKKKIRQNIPIAIGYNCPYVKRKDGDCAQHSFAVTGYKKVCKSKNSTDCKSLIHVQNSYGKEWQEKNNDGWLDAENILSKVSPKAISLKNNGKRIPILSWLE